MSISQTDLKFAVKRTFLIVSGLFIADGVSELQFVQDFGFVAETKIVVGFVILFIMLFLDL